MQKVSVFTASRGSGDYYIAIKPGADAPSLPTLFTGRWERKGDVDLDDHPGIAGVNATSAEVKVAIARDGIFVCEAHVGATSLGRA